MFWILQLGVGARFARRTGRWGMRAVLGTGVALPIVLAAVWFKPPWRITRTESPAPPAASPDALAARDAELRGFVVGRWKGYFQGERTLEVRGDGTATMVSHPEGMAAMLLARKLEFDITWTIEKGVFHFETTGGRPADKTALVANMYGKKRYHPVLQAEGNRLVLQDEDGKTEYVWTRE